MSVTKPHAILSQIVNNQVGLRNQEDEDIYYQQQPNGTFERDVEKVAKLLKKHSHLVPDRPFWSAQCSTFLKGRCNFGHDCYYAHGKVLWSAMRQFRKSHPTSQPQLSYEIPLSARQSERLAQRVQQAHGPVAAPASATDLGPYGLSQLLAPLPSHASCDLEKEFSTEEQTTLLYHEDGSSLFIDFMVKPLHAQASALAPSASAPASHKTQKQLKPPKTSALFTRKAFNALNALTDELW